MVDSFLRELPAHQMGLWKFALRLTRNQHDAEDLLQRSYVRAIEKRSQWQPATSMKSWVFAIMHSIWVNDLQHPRLRLVESLEQMDVPDWDIASDETTHNPEHRLHFKQIILAVESLPEAQRMVMLLVGIEGFSYQEAAEVLSIPIGTVMSRLARARVAIGSQFAHHQQNHSSAQYA
jgi:RNA polymerase sigma-70 factor, ECF subfamily